MNNVQNTTVFSRRTGLRVMGISGLAGLAACTAGRVETLPAAVTEPVGEGTTVVPPDTGLTPNQVAGVPIPAGRIEAAVDHIEGVATGLLSRAGIPGMAVAVVHGGRTVFARGFGVKQVDVAGDIDADTVFQLASLSKPIGATVVARQVTTGRIAWETPVTEHLPEFALADPYVSAHLTIGDCYAHRSGLPAQAGDIIEDLGYSRKEVLRRLRFLPLDPFRISYHYTNWGMTAGAEAAAAAAGLDWESLSERDLYAPLGMRSTSSRFADFVARDNRAVGHALVDGHFRPAHVRQPDAQSPAGGVSSSVNDLAAWLALVLADGRSTAAGATDDGHLVSAAALGAALTPQVLSAGPATPDSRSGFYGFGFNVGVQPSGRVQFSHSGAFTLGAGTNVVFLPSADVAIVTLTNAAPIGVAEAMNAEFMDLVQFGAAQRDWYDGYHRLLSGEMEPWGEWVGQVPPPEPVAAAPSEKYVGEYGSDCFGALAVVEGPDGLTLELGPQRTGHPMTHWSGNDFTIRFDTEATGLGSVSRVTFRVPDSGPAATVVVEVLDRDGVGTFARTT